SRTRDVVASTAPTVVTGRVHATPHAEDAAVRPADVASAIKQIAPPRVKRSSSSDIEHATDAASMEFAVDGSPGTARNPAAAPNTTAMTLSVSTGIPCCARRTATAPTAAVTAMVAAVTTWPTACVMIPDHTSAAAPRTAELRHAALVVAGDGG